MDKKWNFPHGRNLTPRGVNDPAINSFLDNVVDSLTREVIQNSLDAKDREVNEAVKVSFTIKNVRTELIPGIEEIKNFALPRAIEFWTSKGNQGTVEYLENFRRTIESKEVKVLKISDFNTYGLGAKSYDALVLGNGYTEKFDDNAAGSKGIGKAAPFAISDLRLVFYNSIPKSENQKYVGVLNFVSFSYDEKYSDNITQERALYQSGSLEYVPGQIDFGFEKRGDHQYGTDLFIIGLRDLDEEWDKKILLSSINNFLVSLLDNKLVVQVNNTILNQDNLGEIISSLEDLRKSQDERRVFEDTKNYYDALRNSNRLEFNLDDRFLSYDFIKDVSDGKLILLKRENANRAILQTRISGMKIYDRRSISGNINFTGVFRAIGSDFDKFLKSLENTNHN